MISKFFDSQNQPKSDFDPILLENRSFPGLGVDRKVVDNGLYYLKYAFSAKSLEPFGSKWPKILKNPQKWLFLAQNCL
jgi:hypothetical protein